MIKINDKVVVRRSADLEALRLLPLIGYKGKVCGLMPYNRTPGAMVHFNCRFRGEYRWFVPFTALYTHDMRSGVAKNELLEERI